MQLVEVRPLKPFVGSFRCSLAEADYIDESLAEKDGLVVKDKVPRKRFVGLISVTRAMTKPEHADWIAGKLAAHLEPSEDGRAVTEHPRVRTVHVPPAVASSLVSRGLAEVVEKDKKAAVKAA